MFDVGLIVGQANHEQGGALDTLSKYLELVMELLGSHC